MCRWQPCLDTVPAKLTISNRSSRDTVSFDPRLPSAFASRRDTFDSDPTHVTTHPASSFAPLA